MRLKELSKVIGKQKHNGEMPALFVGHGNPMNAILENDNTRNWASIGHELHPKAILCISAHWQTKGTLVTAMEKPRTIHDFYGFPKTLSETMYQAPGKPEMAQNVIQHVQSQSVEEDHEWGLDHGTWSVLIKMFPNADVPVFQLSLDYGLSLKAHYELAKELKYLRKKGVLIVGSGNIVHNLRQAQWESNQPYEWAIEFDNKVKELIDGHSHEQLIQYDKLGQSAQLSVPTTEHFLPMIYSLGVQTDQDQLTYFNETMEMGSIGMRSFLLS